MITSYPTLAFNVTMASLRQEIEVTIKRNDEVSPMIQDGKSADLPPQNKKSKSWVKSLVCWMSCGLVIVIVAMTIVVLRHMHQQSRNSRVIEPQPLVKLDITDLLNNWENSDSWNIVQYDYGKDQTSYDSGKEAIRVLYSKGSWAPSAGETDGYGGFNFYASPATFPTNEACLQYNLKFEQNFDWVKGGKLPGMWIGNIGASGGNHDVNGYSYRSAWHANGAAQAYLYIPKQQSPDLGKQPGFINSDVYGDALWRGQFAFDTNTWYSVKLYIKLNTFNGASPHYDGVIGMAINNTTHMFDKIVWTDNKQHTINGIMMDTFFGGSDISWASSQTTYSYFRNFVVSRGKC